MKFMSNARRLGRKYHQNTSGIRTEPKPDFWGKRFDKSEKILVIACGALAKEITALIRMNNWTHLQIRYLPRENFTMNRIKFHKIFENIWKMPKINFLAFLSVCRLWNWRST
ncbi:MAG: hypothetical protein CM1200mP30_00560 [Pseudomonadota bacterium]|nr:MAG: hypothetical protein CM1200mP30_00560 [Pseudomonadota bacterium]